MAYWPFQGNTKYYRVVDGIRNFEQVPWLVNCHLLRVIAVRLVDVFGNDALICTLTATCNLKS